MFTSQETFFLYNMNIQDKELSLHSKNKIYWVCRDKIVGKYHNRQALYQLLSTYRCVCRHTSL